MHFGYFQFFSAGERTRMIEQIKWSRSKLLVFSSFIPHSCHMKFQKHVFFAPNYIVRLSTQAYVTVPSSDEALRTSYRADNFKSFTMQFIQFCSFFAN